MKKYLPVVVCCCFVLLTGWHSSDTHSHPLKIRFLHLVGKDELVLGNTYQNITGDSITITKFKYYISNVSATDHRGRVTKLPAGYYLVDAADSSSQTILLQAPAASPASISFLVGVDSIRNVSGIQTGALDPLHGMFWTWNSGYIMAKLEGTSPHSTIAGQQFTYHIGGFKKDNNTARMITLQLPSQQEALTEITITADINAWFKSRHQLSIAETPVCHSPGSLAMKIADNYSTMFSLLSVR